MLAAIFTLIMISITLSPHRLLKIPIATFVQNSLNKRDESIRYTRIKLLHVAYFIDTIDSGGDNKYTEDEM